MPSRERQPAGDAEVAVEPRVVEDAAVDLDAELLPAEHAGVGAGLDPQARRVGVGADDAERRVGATPSGVRQATSAAVADHEAVGGDVGPVVVVDDRGEAGGAQPVAAVRRRGTATARRRGTCSRSSMVGDGRSALLEQAHRQAGAAEVRRLVDRDRPIARPSATRRPGGSRCSSGRRTWRCEWQAEHVRQVPVDHAAVAHDGDPVDRRCSAMIGSMRRHTRRSKSSTALVPSTPATVPSAQLVETRDRRSAFSSSIGTYSRRVAVPLGDVVDDHSFEPGDPCERRGGLRGASQRAGVDRVDVLGGQVVGQVLGLAMPVGRESGVGRHHRRLAAHGERVADQQQFHERLD